MWGRGLSSRCATLVLTFDSRAQGDFQAREYVQLKVVKRQLLMFSKIVLKYHPLVEPSGPAGVAEAGAAAAAAPAAV